MIGRERRLEALKNCFLGLILRDFDKRPGGVIERMPPADREALKQLTSEDLRSMRVNPKEFA